MILFDQKFFHDLKQLAGRDLSQAHLQQHFATASFYAQQAQATVSGRGTWSNLKPNDSVKLIDGKITGTKHWVSGASLCDYAVIGVHDNKKYSVVMVETQHAAVEPVPTLGMEDTVTVNLTFDQAPAQWFYERQDPVCWPVDSFHNLGFLTVTLGLMQALLTSLHAQTPNKYDYEKKKLRLDMEMMNLAWMREVEQVNESWQDQKEFWVQRNLLYAFGKKALTNVVQFVTEVAVSGLYQSASAHHQRYKDALIYCTHMKNISNAVDQCFYK